jgi:hypothetical protein
MNTFNKKKIYLTVAAVLLLLTIPLTISIMSQRQETRQRAAASTTLTFAPESTTGSPIVKNVGDPIALDIMVNPGQNLVTFVRYQITFDPTKVQLNTSNPITLNSAIFSSVEGPITTATSIAQSVSIGSDPTKALQQPTKIGTINFTAIAPTTGATTSIAYGTLSQALSSGANDQASQNVLSSTTPATILINGSGGVTPSIGTPSATIVPQPTIDGTAVTFNLFLHGVGAAGDNPNPTGNTLSNKNPVHPQRNLQVEVYDTNNQLVASASAPVNYDPSTGTFTGKMGLGKNVESGNYNIKVKTDRYLRRLVPGIQQLQKDVDNELPDTQMVAGDSNGDNFLNVIDYNALLDCGYGELNPLPQADANSKFNTNECKAHKPVVNVDIDDNGVVNSFDYNLFLRELSVQNGD